MRYVTAAAILVGEKKGAAVFCRIKPYSGFKFVPNILGLLSTYSLPVSVRVEGIYVGDLFQFCWKRKACFK